MLPETSFPSKISISHQHFPSTHLDSSQRLKNLDVLRQVQNFTPKSLIRESKQSASTQPLQMELKQSWLKESCVNSLDFTFTNPLDFTFNEIGVSHVSSRLQSPKYGHLSPHAVLLYGLLFNHLHLQNIQESLPQIIKFSNELITIIKVAFLKLWKYIKEKQQTTSLTPSTFFYLLQTNTAPHSQKVYYLKQLFNQLDCASACLIFKAVLQEKKYGSSPPKVSKGNPIKGKRILDSGVLENSLDKDFFQFAEAMGIRIKLSQEKDKKQFGSKTNYVLVRVNRKEGSQLFFLKEISCYEENKQILY